MCGSSLQLRSVVGLFYLFLFFFFGFFFQILIKLKHIYKYTCVWIFCRLYARAINMLVRHCGWKLSKGWQKSISNSIINCFYHQLSRSFIGFLLIWLCVNGTYSFFVQNDPYAAVPFNFSPWKNVFYGLVWFSHMSNEPKVSQ